jgi:hypothetical protein
MIDELIRQLQSPDPAERRNAIIALANTKDPAALKPLATVYRSDPDPALREMALKAGRYIHQQSEPMQAGPGPSMGAADDSAGASAAQIGGTSEPVSKRKQQIAKGHLDAAVGFHTQGYTARAVESLGKALATDPNLIKSAIASNLAITLTDRPLKDAIPILTQPKLREAFVDRLGGKAKLSAQQHGKGAETATWNNVLVDVFLYWLVLSLSTVAILLFSLQMLDDMLADMPSSTGDATFDAEEVDVFSLESLLVMIPSAMFSSAYSVVGLMVMGFAIHMVAMNVMNGRGTLVFLYRKIVPIMTIAALLMAGFFVVLSLAGSWEAVSLYFGTGMLVGFVVFFLVMSAQVGEVYDFGFTGGCGAIILGIIVLIFMLGCGWCGLIELLA